MILKTLASYIRKLKDRSGNYVLPAVRAKGVYLDNDTDLQTYLDNIDNIRKAFFPVGAIYQTTNPTSPASLFGGRWTQIQGRFLIGQNSTYGLNETGGEATHKLTTNEIPSHTHGSKSLTGSFWNIAFQENFYGACDGIVSWKGTKTQEVAYASTLTDRNHYDGFKIDATHEHSSVGGGAAHNNMPPWYGCYIWNRVG